MEANAAGCTSPQTCCGINLGTSMQAKITDQSAGKCSCLNNRIVTLQRPPGILYWQGMTIACDSSPMTMTWSCDNGTGSVGLEIEGCDITGGGSIGRVSISCGQGYKAIYSANVRPHSCCGSFSGSVSVTIHITVMG